MAASNAILGFGAVFKISDGAETPADVTIAEVVSVGWPSVQVDDVEVTHHGSPDDFREYIGGLKDAGEVSVTINWIPGDASSNMLLGLVGTRTVRAMKIVTANDFQAAFPGYIKGFEVTQETSSALQATVTIRVAGAPVFTDES